MATSVPVSMDLLIEVPAMNVEPHLNPNLGDAAQPSSPPNDTSGPTPTPHTGAPAPQGALGAIE